MNITRLLRYVVVVPLCEIESTGLLSGMSLFHRIFRKFPRFLNFGMLTFSEGGVGELPSHFVAASRHIPKVPLVARGYFLVPLDSELVYSFCLRLQSTSALGRSDSYNVH